MSDRPRVVDTGASEDPADEPTSAATHRAAGEAYHRAVVEEHRQATIEAELDRANELLREHIHVTRDLGEALGQAALVALLCLFGGAALGLWLGWELWG